MYGDMSAVRFIKIARLQWLGHVHRMEDGELTKRVMMVNPVGKRRVGRPKLRWLDGVTADCRVLGVNWRTVALDRREWRQILEAAKTHQGL